MSVSELNHLMTYVIEGWMLFSAGFTSIAFVSFVARRSQEDRAAAELAQLERQAEQVSESESLTVAAPDVTVAQTAPVSAPVSKAPPTETDELLAEEDMEAEDISTAAKDAARLEEVAAVSEKLAKEKQKQSGTSSVSVSTGSH